MMDFDFCHLIRSMETTWTNIRCTKAIWWTF